MVTDDRYIAIDQFLAYKKQKMWISEYANVPYGQHLCFHRLDMFCNHNLYEYSL